MLAQWSMRGKIETLMNMVKSLFLAGLLAFAPGSVSAQDVAPAPQTATAAPAGAATDSAPAAAASVPALKPVEGIGMPPQGALGRASCRASVCPYVSISVVAVSLNKKNKQPH